MKAMVLKKILNLDETRSPLDFDDVAIPKPSENEILVKILACGVCHTELDEIEGRSPPSKYPVILGHQIIGRVETMGSRGNKFRIGDRVGISWINSSCGTCRYCLTGMENLCDNFKATGRDADGGYAEFTTVPEAFAFMIPKSFSDAEAAPLLCAGAIGYRSLRLANMKDGDTIGLAGFGASAHLVLKMVQHLYPKTEIYVFSRTEGERTFAKELGAIWTGDSEEKSPEKLHAVIDTTPAWKPVVSAMKNLEKGGRLVINAIRKEERDKDAIHAIDYNRDLWMEKEVKSVANITRSDVENFLKLAAEIPIKPEIQEYPLENANIALLELKERKIRGAKVLKIS